MKIHTDTPIEIINRVDPRRSAFLNAWCVWRNGDDEDDLAIWNLDYGYWEELLVIQCNFRSDKQLIKFSFKRDGRNLTGYVFCCTQWLCAIQAMLGSDEKKIQFEIVTKEGFSPAYIHPPFTILLHLSYHIFHRRRTSITQFPKITVSPNMDPETSQALATRISRILQSVIEVSHESLPRLAAIELDSVYAGYATRSQPVTFLQFIQHIWDAFMRVAGQLDRNGDGHRKLARIIRWLEKLPNRPFPDDYDESDDILSGYDLGGTGLWDAFTRVAPSIPLSFEGLSSTDAEFQRCLNVHAFTALLTKSLLIPLPRQTILAIGQATEGVMVQEEDGGPEFVSGDPSDIEQLDMKVAVAAIWIQHAGHVLWRSNPRDTISEGGPFWKQIYASLSKDDSNHLSLYRERWGVWMLQFGEISENSDVAEETRDIAEEAHDTLDEIYSIHMHLYRSHQESLSLLQLNS
ncbi:hypothetical protein BDV30DRAFT_233095 [Aspergillus minisclerotigenes]|uniref:Uncharacterized protein n=1 Tax=Aspergillus minisclerotigenes TaxID=656917 RepID=A0A5N6JJY4_9EURO|nr:hypothetical protein BDV30DRAFT_233095 [Aspergillus minisclerotigenes]